MSGLAQLCFKANVAHEEFVVLLPYGMAFRVTVKHDVLHVIRKDLLRHAHVLKCVEHPDEQVFLLGVWEKLHISLSACVADHGETGNLVGRSASGFNSDKVPVHLVTLAGKRLISSAPVSLRRYDHSLRREKILMVSDIVFYGGFSTFVAALP